jgi:tRNA(Ile)-lysidine synthase
MTASNKKIEEKVINFAADHNLIDKGDRILVALSGGPDSIFMLNFLLKFRKKYQVKIAVIHVNHQLRKEESKKDEQFCEKICRKYNLQYIGITHNVKEFSKTEKISIEEAGRKLRYKEFYAAIAKINFNKIATAHNLNDNTETVLLNLIKGTGLKGLCGIPIVRDKVIRPILCISKDEILDYLKNNKIPYRVDKTNKEIVFQRNYIRKELLPRMRRQINSNLDENIFNLSKIVSDYYLFIEKKFLDKAINSYIEFNNDELFIGASLMMNSNFTNALKGEVIKQALKNHFVYEADYLNIKRCLALFNQQAGKEIKLSKELTALKTGKGIIFTKEIQSDFAEKKLKLNSGTRINEKTLSISVAAKDEVVYSNNKNVEFVNGDNLSMDFCVRTWKEGDRFFPLGMKSSKKVSDFLTDRKISAELKRKQLVLINKKNIVWILGLQIDDRIKINNKTKTFIKLELKNG